MFRYQTIALLAVLPLFGCDKPVDLVVDKAGLLTSDQAGNIAKFHQYLLSDHDIDYRVMTITQGIDLNHYATEQFESQRVGGASKSGRGLLLVLDTQQNKVRFEVSRALEAAYPDAFVAYIEQRQMTPFFAAGRVADGVLATTELIVTRAQQTQKNHGWDDEVWAKATTSGGGATASARLDGASVPDQTASRVNTALPGGIAADVIADTPENTLQAYFTAMSERNINPELAIYTAQTKAMLKQWVLTPAQMDSVVSTYRGCHAEAAHYDTQQTLAVIRYPVDERMCSPWFFVRDGEHWQLELTAMQQYIQFGRDNSWHFDWRMLRAHSYQFAFEDWGFDNRGYPQKMRWNMTVSSDRERNVWVERLGENSPAKAFGFAVGDQLLSWNGHVLTHHGQVMQAMSEAESGELVKVDIARDGKAMQLENNAPPK